MDNIIIVLVLVGIVGLAAWYVIRAKKRGAKCIGCPDGQSSKSEGCSGCCGSCSGCKSGYDDSIGNDAANK